MNAIVTMDKPPTLEITAGKYDELIECGPVRIEAQVSRKGGYSYTADLAIFGVEAIINIRVRPDNDDD